MNQVLPMCGIIKLMFYQTFLALSRELLTNSYNYGLLILMNLANWTVRLLKNNCSLQTETYLNCNNNCKYRNAWCKFRMSAHSLEIETGRYNATPLEQRVCKFCTSPHVENLRRKFIPRFCWSFVNINKFKFIMCSNFERSILNLEKYFLCIQTPWRTQTCKFIAYNHLFNIINIILDYIFSCYNMSH